ncbi:unnamed protein product [Rangifer tarandus platyrhynchus]|uniref:Uncharacterized protein n=1 Tax=Rangifer tarandus platyrhynchus TaxID=3082113 RepID=A0AC59YH70_RANTA
MKAGQAAEGPERDSEGYKIRDEERDPGGGGRGSEPRTPTLARFRKLSADRVRRFFGLAFPVTPNARPTLKGRQFPRGSECKKRTVSPPPSWVLRLQVVERGRNRDPHGSKGGRELALLRRDGRRVQCAGAARSGLDPGSWGRCAGGGGACAAAWAPVAREGGRRREGAGPRRPRRAGPSWPMSGVHMPRRRREGRQPRINAIRAAAAEPSPTPPPSPPPQFPQLLSGVQR